MMPMTSNGSSNPLRRIHDVIPAEMIAATILIDVDVTAPAGQAARLLKAVGWIPYPI